MTRQPNRPAPAGPPDDEPDGDEPTVKEWGDWKVVGAGTWEISISPDGLLQLPRHLHPREVDDFVRAATHATKIANEMIAANEARAEGDDRSIPPARAIVTEGRPPAGTVPMMITPGPNQPQTSQASRAAIGRPRIRGPAPQPAQLPARRGRG